MDPEEHYGLIAMEPAARPPLQQQTPLLADGNVRVFMGHDESYLKIRIEPVGNPREEILVGLDVTDPRTGSFAWPDKVPLPLEHGIDFSLRINADEARLFAVNSALPTAIVPAHADIKGAPVAEFPKVARQPFGFFRGRYAGVLNMNYNFLIDGRPALQFEPIRIMTSRSRWMRDNTEVAAMGYEWGYLPPGKLPDGLWQRDERTGVIEVNIPWQLINVIDPSSRRVLTMSSDTHGARSTSGKAIADIGVTVAARTGSRWTQTQAARFTWPEWEQPRWQERPKPAYDALREAWKNLDTPATKTGAVR